MVSGADVPPHYDSLIARIVASGTDRAECMARMKSALAELRVEGITVNADLHRFILGDAAFEAGGVTIDDLEERLRRRLEARLRCRAKASPGAGS
jgi:acetyl-CoA carboxylase biotin carboxylase subunit